MPEDLEEAKLGTCDLCQQELILTADDCWHPWTIERECPGSQYGRPGREHWRPSDQPPDGPPA